MATRKPAVSAAQLEALSQEFTRRVLAADAPALLAWLAGLPQAERHALQPLAAQLHYRPRGKDSRAWGAQRDCTTLAQIFCARKAIEVSNFHFGTAELLQCVAAGPLPWLDARRRSAFKRGQSWPSDLGYLDELWLQEHGHVSEPAPPAVMAQLLANGVCGAQQPVNWRERLTWLAPRADTVPARYWRTDLWLLFHHPNLLAQEVAEAQRVPWIEWFCAQAGVHFPREQAIREVLTGTLAAGLKRPQVMLQVQLLHALKPSAAEWAPHQPQLLAALGHAQSVLQGLAVDAWHAQAQAGLPLPLDALLPMFGGLWAVRVKALHRQALALYAELLPRTAGDAEARQAQLDTLLPALLVPDADLHKRLVQLLAGQFPDRAALARLLAPWQEPLQQQARQWLQAQGVALTGEATAPSDAAPSAADAADALAPASHDPEPLPDPEPLGIAVDRYEDWCLALTEALRGHAFDAALWHQATNGMLLHLPALTAAQWPALSPAMREACERPLRPLAGVFAHLLWVLSEGTDAPAGARAEVVAWTKAFTGLTPSHWQRVSLEVRQAPGFGQLLALVHARVRAGVRLPLLSTPSHAPLWISVPALVQALAQHEAASVAPDLLDLQLALHRLWLPAAGSPAHDDACAALASRPADDELRALLGWLLDGAAALPVTAITPALASCWASAALAHGRALDHPALQQGQHPLATYAALGLRLPPLRCDDPAAPLPEATAAEQAHSYPGKAQDLQLCLFARRRLVELDPAAAWLADSLNQLRMPTGWRRPESPEAVVADLSAAQLIKAAGTNTLSDALRRHWRSHSELPLERERLHLWFEHLLWAARQRSQPRDGSELLAALPTLPALALLASIQHVRHQPLGPIEVLQPIWPDPRHELPELLHTLLAFAGRLPWTDGLGLWLAHGLDQKDASLRALAAEWWLREARHVDAARIHHLGRVLGLCLFHGQLQAPRLAETMLSHWLPETSHQPLLRHALRQCCDALLCQLPPQPQVRQFKDLLAAYAEVLALTASQPLPAALDVRLEAWAKAAPLKAGVRTVRQIGKG